MVGCVYPNDADEDTDAQPQKFGRPDFWPARRGGEDADARPEKVTRVTNWPAPARRDDHPASTLARKIVAALTEAERGGPAPEPEPDRGTMAGRIIAADRARRTPR